MQKTYKNILRHFWDFLLASQILSSLQQRAGNPTAVHVQKSCVSKHMLNCSWFVWCYGFQNQQKLAWIPKNSAEKYARASFADLVSSIRYTCEAVFRLGFYTLYLLSLELTPVRESSSCSKSLKSLHHCTRSFKSGKKKFSERDTQGTRLEF